MFSSKGFFSQTPCPHTFECHLPRCIFSHQPLITSTEVNNAKEAVLEEHIAPDEQRKRRKLNEIPGKAATQSLPVTQVTSDSNGKTNVKRTRTGSTVRPISPPPLKRKTQQSPSLESLARSTTKLQSSIARTKVAPKSQINVPKKEEVLNPRTLKGPAPAAYDLRLRLARGLHEHFQRLNSDLKKDGSKEEEELVLSDQELISMALDIEEDAAQDPLIYSNVVKNKILIYKRMSMQQWVEERQKDVATRKAKEAASSQALASTNVTWQLRSLDTGLGPEAELSLLSRIYTPISGLSRYGYVNKVPTDTEIEQARQGVEASQGWEVCDRCKTRFQVFPERRPEDGALASGGTCTYHHGKTFYQERLTDGTKEKRIKRFRCCGEGVGDSVGCTKASYHVFKITDPKRQASIMNFALTPENTGTIHSQPVCIDGEMGYTVFGLELIRLTATSWPSGTPIFDVLVRPLGGILDLNSRFSGVWPADFTTLPTMEIGVGRQGKAVEGNRTLQIVDSPGAARDLLFSHISPETPLIGHGLENDLNAVRVIHPTIIDTVLLYPHKAGLPFRNSLKALMDFHLNRQIQVVISGKMEGHDSKEDANAAGDLVRFKLKNEWIKLRREGWILEDGTVFKSPRSELNLNEGRS